MRNCDTFSHESEENPELGVRTVALWIFPTVSFWNQLKLTRIYWLNTTVLNQIWPDVLCSPHESLQHISLQNLFSHLPRRHVLLASSPSDTRHLGPFRIIHHRIYPSPSKLFVCPVCHANSFSDRPRRLSRVYLLAFTTLFSVFPLSTPTLKFLIVLQLPLRVSMP